MRPASNRFAERPVQSLHLALLPAATNCPGRAFAGNSACLCTPGGTASALRYQPKSAFGTVPLGPLVFGRIIVKKTAADDKVRSRTRHNVPACVEDFNEVRITLNRVSLWPYEGIYRLVGKRRMNTAVAINSQRAFKTRVHALFLRHIDSDEPERGRRRRGCAGADHRRQQQGQSKSDQS